MYSHSQRPLDFLHKRHSIWWNWELEMQGREVEVSIIFMIVSQPCGAYSSLSQAQS